MTRCTLMMAAALSIGAVAMAQEADTTDDLAQLRADYAKLKLEHDEAMDELRDLRAAVVTEDEAETAPGVQTTVEQAPARPQLTDEEAAELLKRIADQQDRLESQVDTLIARQREIEQRVGESRAAATPASSSYTTTIDSPYAYRYERTEERIIRNPTIEADKPVIVSPKYTIYSSGYTSDAYVLPTRPARTVAPPVYVNTTNFYHGTYYPSGYRVYDRYPHHGYYRRGYYRPSGGVTVGIVGGSGYFRYSSGGFYCR